MKMYLFFAGCLGLVMMLGAREVSVLTEGWLFSQEGSTPRAVRVPHDYAIEGDFDPVQFSAYSGALAWQSKGHYARTLVCDEKPMKERLFLECDGAMASAICRVNGHVVGKTDYGYLGFCADLTPYLMKGKNTLTIDTDSTRLKSRWYPGAGLIREVRLVRTPLVYLVPDELVVSTPTVSAHEATVCVKGQLDACIDFKTDASVKVELISPEGTCVAAHTQSLSLTPYERTMFKAELKIKNPQLWNLSPHPPLYRVRVTSEQPALKAQDELMVRTGFRSFKLDAEKGFFLNGQHERLRGVCLHADLGLLGAAYNHSAMRRQLTKLRDMGVNALRTSHNPPAPQVLDLCDEMGFFVWDECFDKWNSTMNNPSTDDKTENLEQFVAQHLKQFVRRDRNHPCVFVWSIGNEISIGEAAPPGQERWDIPWSTGTTKERCARFRAAVRSEDSSRLVGIGSCFPNAGARGDYDFLDVVGWNYGGKYRAFRISHPHIPSLYTESASALSGVQWYDEKPPTHKAQYAQKVFRVDCYDHNAAQWSDIPDVEFWRMENDRDIAGEFVWTGIDYLGEPTPYPEVLPKSERARSSYFGIFDLCVFPKDRVWLYRAHWRPDAFTLHIVPSHWNFKSGARPVYVYSNAAEVELFLNGQSLGKRTKNTSLHYEPKKYFAILPRYRFVWDRVNYAPGELKAVAYDAQGKLMGTNCVWTAHDPASLILEPEEKTIPDTHTLVFVKVFLVDQEGHFVPSRTDRIHFSMEGAGEIVSVGNADARGRQSFKKIENHCLFDGVAAVVVRRTGKGMIRLKASSGTFHASCDFREE